MGSKKSYNGKFASFFEKKIFSDPFLTNQKRWVVSKFGNNLKIWENLEEGDPSV
jgi:hypothetical protein